MNEIELKLYASRDLTYELVERAVANSTGGILKILWGRAYLLHELGYADEAQADRLAAEFIQQHSDNFHFQLCCKRAAAINLVAVAERNGVHGFDPR